MRRRALEKVLLTSSAAIVIAAVFAFLALRWIAARDVDAHAEAQTRFMVENAVKDFAADLSTKTFAQAYWDDAVLNLDNRFDRAWADSYIGTFFWHTYGLERIVTFDRDDRVTFAVADGYEVRAAAVSELVEAAGPFIANVRQAEAARGPLPNLIELTDPLPVSAEGMERPTATPRGRILQPITKSGLVSLDGQPYAVSITLVQPDRKTRPLTSRSAMILIAKRLDAVAVGQIARKLSLKDARVVPGRDEDVPGMWSLPLRDGRGEAIGAIQWRADYPGSEMIRQTSVAVALFAAVIGLMAWLGLRRGQAIARDLSDSELRASELAYYDKLTGLPNRAGIELAYEKILQDARRRDFPMAIGCVDIDRFKSVNDRYGHAAGDELLRQAAKRIAACCEGNFVLGRYGGDEFVILCDGHDAAHLQMVAEATNRSLAEPFDVGAGQVFVGSSIGICFLLPGATLDAPEALRRADLAMYKAKEQGGNGHAFYTPELDDAVIARTAAQESLRATLAAGTLEVAYQPQSDCSGRVVGAEALVRWPKSSDHSFETADFVRLAEQTGHIEELGLQVLKRVLSDAGKWPGLPLAINLSAMQLRTDAYVAQIIDAILASEVEPGRLQFEITESTLLDQTDATIHRIQSLRDLGCTVALDDFGTGFCGLSYLHLYPIDRVKIDMSFVALLGKEPRAQALVETVVRLAKVLDLGVIAEGVETEDQRSRLIEMGCFRFQGYLTGKPMPASALSERLAGELITSSPPTP